MWSACAALLQPGAQIISTLTFLASKIAWFFTHMYGSTGNVVTHTHTHTSKYRSPRYVLIVTFRDGRHWSANPQPNCTWLHTKSPEFWTSTSMNLCRSTKRSGWDQHKQCLLICAVLEAIHVEQSSLSCSVHFECSHSTPKSLWHLEYGTMIAARVLTEASKCTDGRRIMP